MPEPGVSGPTHHIFVRAATALAGLNGWRRYLVAAVFGGLASAALPPLYLVPLLWPAFAGLLWLMNGVARARGAFLTGWAFGGGHFLGGLYWVGIAFLVDADQFAVFLPLAVAGLAAGIGLFPALALLVVWRSGWRGPARVLLLAAAWLAAEWLRSWIFTGFPWNLIGSVWVFSDQMMQLAAFAGVWGLSLVTVIVAAAPAILGEPARFTVGRRWAPLALALLLPSLLWAGGAWRLSTAPPPGGDTVAGVRLRLVQPSVAQSAKWRPELRRQHVLDQIALSRGAGAPSHVIWSETAVPFDLSGDQELREAVAEIVPPGGLLITGAPRFARDDGTLRLWNSLHVLNGGAEILGTYDKFHLVPFGEYVPLKWLLGFAKVTQGRLDFTPGPGLRTLQLPGLPPASPLICYEVIFPGAVTAPGDRPAWLLNVTNDAWFGVSSGPYQHFASARLRAVEEGLPLVRVANSGISAVVDGYGRTLARLGLTQVGVIDSPLPRPTASRTLFSQAGNWSVLALIALALLTGRLLSKRSVD